MTKQEFMETYTRERLAEMVVSKQNIIDDMKSNIDYLNRNLERKKRIINQIDYILEKLFGVRHDTVDKPDEFEKILSERIKGNVTDFLPIEPIKVADMLINEFRKGDNYTYLGISELRQIAEHLLVYCNHNGKVEE